MISTAPVRLNPAQKKAVLHKKGPLLIVAGAGTGKTTVITERIAHLIQSNAAKPSQILALTFTEKAAEEIGRRLDHILPLGYEELWVKTFHGFCDRMLKEYGHEIGIDAGYTLLDEVAEWMFLKKNIFNMDLNHYRPLGNPSKFISMLLNHFHRLKDEDISPETYEAAVKDEQDQELAHAYREYQRLKITENFLDFSDLIFFTLRLLEARPAVRAEMTDRFPFMLVDEFQDTNYAQTKLTMLLAETDKNLTVVGDDDQSIYRWRGASLSNIIEFEKRFPKAKKIVITENYRSAQNILDASYTLIQHNNPDRLEIRAKINKKLRSQCGAGLPPEIWHFNHYFEEVAAVADRISEEKKNGKKIYRDFAILVRANQHAAPFIEELLRREIPFQVRNAPGFFHLEAVKDVIAILRVIHDISDDIALYRVLSMPLFNISIANLSGLMKQIKETEHHPLELPGLESEFSRVRVLIEDLREFSRTHSAGQVIMRFLERSGYLKSLINADTSDAHEKIQNLSSFSALVKEFEITHRDHMVRDFLRYLELLEEAEGTLPETSATREEDAIQILTVHAAKGLEFDTVFMVNSVKDRFPAVSRREPFTIPPSLIHESLPHESHHLQEERRLMYVACTRAKRQLILTYSDRYEGKKPWKISPFLEEIKKSGQVICRDFSEARPMTIEHEPTGRTEKRAKEIPLSKISFTQLDTFATCPLKFQFRYLLRLPEPVSHAASFGSSVHETLNDFYQRLKKGETPSPELLQKCYETHWMPYGYESRAHMLKRRTQGKELLEAFYQKNFIEIAPILPAYLERNFRLKIGEVTLNGRIDRIDRLQDGTYEVIDYKTGANKNKPLSSNLQLSIYALACKEVFQLPISLLSLYFLEGNEKISTKRTEENLTRVQQELLEIVQEIRASEFQPTPGFHCQFCEFRIICPAM